MAKLDAPREPLRASASVKTYLAESEPTEREDEGVAVLYGDGDDMDSEEESWVLAQVAEMDIDEFQAMQAVTSLAESRPRSCADNK
eukprot:10361530-Lingulodinium_polyedra.AAC.1